MRSSRQYLSDALFVGVLVLYLLAGAAAVPFHGDESTIMFMSRDWHTLAHLRDFGAVRYNPNMPDGGLLRLEQDLRLINGVISKYAVGLAWSLAGMRVDDLPGPWAWNIDWYQNAYYGHIPKPDVLFVSRMASALMAALSIAVVFVIGRRIGGRGAAWLAAFVYATMPVVLLNGRRAMFEGALLLSLALVLWAGVELARWRGSDMRGWVRSWLSFGAAVGFAICAKHTNLIIAVGVVIGLTLVSLRAVRPVVRTLGGTALALGVAGVIFFALNPAWWGDPLQMPGIVLKMRADLLADQTQMYGAQTDTGERLIALLRFPLGPPQYFEDTRYDWIQWIGDDIRAYERYGVAGLNWYGPIAFVLLLVGAARLAVARTSPAVVLLAVLLSTLGAIFALTPVPWQRYYLPLSAPLAVTFGLGAWTCLEAVRWLLARCAPRLRGSAARLVGG